MKSRQAAFRPWALGAIKLPQFLKTLVFAGVEGYSRRDKRFLAVANVTGYLGALSSLSFAITFAMVDFNALRAAVIGNIVSATGTILTPFTHRFGRSAAAIYLGVVFYSTLYFFVSVLGRESGIQLNYIAAAAITITILGVQRVHIAFPLMALGLILHLFVWFSFPTGSGAGAVDPSLMSAIYIQSATTIMIILAVATYYILQLSEAAQARSDALLLNIMPSAIAERLIDNPDQVIAEYHAQATVMFADLREFTQLAAELGPEPTVALLDELFSTFDMLADRRGVEKIKTIGDAYMAVAGVPIARADHAAAIMRLAEDMRDALPGISQKAGRSLQLRIGIESGPVVAGVIGRAKFAYDVWGHTVNVAARFQQLAGSGEIIAGKGFFAAIGDEGRFKPLGEQTLQGIGVQQAWLLNDQVARGGSSV
ncbi:adenylate/guanylate cyclase domain-containing protein [Hyphococcus flavus]|uniref:Adenylate/guanylate cyclase domain-containing protein n=1 Tax=Hyphococcus flavus TaxID=1866326 RepID=A0AAE9ZGU9_9PROT|nr:adenylate/guanylate cyclase domain-containing protein [Hyphococcus flavus]WDI32522.1 adenylate/guanylate cyclase domain-containing protein [Hyphococcus flavus]